MKPSPRRKARRNGGSLLPAERIFAPPPRAYEPREWPLVVPKLRLVSELRHRGWLVAA